MLGKRMRETMPGARRALGEMLAATRRGAGGRRPLSVEQVAERAGVGANWIRWLEAGRNIGLSPAAPGGGGGAPPPPGGAPPGGFEVGRAPGGSEPPP